MADLRRIATSRMASTLSRSRHPRHVHSFDLDGSIAAVEGGFGTCDRENALGAGPQRHEVVVPENRQGGRPSRTAPKKRADEQCDGGASIFERERDARLPSLATHGCTC